MGLVTSFIKKVRTRLEENTNAHHDEELYQFLLSKLGPNGWTYSSLDGDGVRFREDNPFIHVSGNEDLHGSLERIRQFGLERKSCYSSFMNPEGFCGNCYFGYFDIDGDAHCSLDLAIEKLTGASRYDKKTLTLKCEIARKYHKQLEGKQPDYNLSLTLLKRNLYLIWKGEKNVR